MFTAHLCVHTPSAKVQMGMRKFVSEKSPKMCQDLQLYDTICVSYYTLISRSSGIEASFVHNDVVNSKKIGTEGSLCLSWLHKDREKKSFTASKRLVVRI